MKIIGIDPGLSGGIAVLENNKVLNIFDIPVMSEGKKNKRQLNSALLVNLLKENINKEEEVAVVVEQVNAMPGQGVTSMFNFGQTFGALKGICAALELPIFFVRPSFLKLIETSPALKKVSIKSLTIFSISIFVMNFLKFYVV